MKVEFGYVDSVKRRYISFFQRTLILKDSYIRLISSCETSEPKSDSDDVDEELFREERFYDYDGIYRKADIINMSFGYTNRYKCYELEIMLNKDDLDFWYSVEDKEKGFDDYKKLFKWWTGDELPEE